MLRTLFYGSGWSSGAITLTFALPGLFKHIPYVTNRSIRIRPAAKPLLKRYSVTPALLKLIMRIIVMAWTCSAVGYMLLRLSEYLTRIFAPLH